VIFFNQSLESFLGREGVETHTNFPAIFWITFFVKLNFFLQSKFFSRQNFFAPKYQKENFGGKKITLQMKEAFHISSPNK
jgi:hypothetical protein